MKMPEGACYNEKSRCFGTGIFLVFSKIFPAPIDNVTLLCYYRNSVTEHCYATPHDNLLTDGRKGMDEELISKKELLETFGISYGALYRWKRMGLIPEAWFLRRSTSTGQETFFRRDQICQRIRLILDNKEHQTLDELAASLAEKHQTVLARRKLIIETAYGRREFPLEEVRSAVVAEGTHQEDILQLLKEITL